MDWATITSIVASIASVITIIILTYKIGRWTKGVEDRLDSLEGGFNSIQSRLKPLILSHAEEHVSFYRRETRELFSSSEKNVLLKKLEEGTITREGALRLRRILKNEREEARAEGAVGAVIGIGEQINSLTFSFPASSFALGVGMGY